MKIVMSILLISVGLFANDMALFGIVNVDKNDTLNVRISPNYKSKKIGQLEKGNIIGISKCVKSGKATWCSIYPLVQQSYEKFRGTVSSWVHSNYLNFSNKGYVLIENKRNCDYSIGCENGKCKIVYDYIQDSNYNITELKTKLIDRNLLKAESNFGATPSDVDGYCNIHSFVNDYLKNIK